MTNLKPIAYSLLALILLTSCEICEGIRQSRPGYVPRSERAQIKKALKDWREGRAEWNRDHAKEISEVPELALLP